jgi:uncharacterized membrane protein
MDESSETATQTHVALDCNWVDALVMCIGGLLCVFVAIGLAWTTLSGHWHVRPLSYTSGAISIAYTVIFFQLVRNRRFRFALVVLLSSEAIRLIFSVAHAPFGVQRATALVDRWVTIAFLAGIASYVFVWFKQKIRHV